MKKFVFKIHTEGIQPYHPFLYQYGNTKDIRLSIVKEGFYLEFEMTVNKTPQEMQDSKLLKDALKKVYLIQLIKYGAVKTNKILFESFNQNQVQLYGEELKPPYLYSLTGNKLIRKPKQNWTSSSLLKIVNTTKSNASRIDATLHAILMAKSKTFESEKFIYLWMAMNGLYGYASNKAKSFMNKEAAKWIDREYAQLKFMAMLNNYPYHVLQKDDNKSTGFIRDVDNFFSVIPEDEIETFIKDSKDHNQKNEYVKQLMSKIEKSELFKEMHPYVMLIIWFPYQIRCKYFHSEKVLPLLCFENESPIPSLRVLNSALEDYLDENIYRWFDEDIINTQIFPKIQMLAENCVCKDNRLQSCIVEGIERA